MTGKGNRFGISPVDMPVAAAPRSRRDPGPLGAAVRETAASAQEAGAALAEQRRQNAAEAGEFRAARAEGRVLVSLPLDRIATDALPRDRLDLAGVAASDEMDELKASIRARGQREPVEVFAAADGLYQLKAGWRRLTALRQLLAETGDPRFGTVIARVTPVGEDRAALYIDMVEENIIRQDLSFAEMAQIAIRLADDPQAGIGSVDAAVARLFRALHKVKRAYIRAFTGLLLAADGALPCAREIPRDLGVAAARRLQATGAHGAAALRAALAGATTAEDQAAALRAFVAGPVPAAPPPARPEVFAVDASQVTARRGEIRIAAAIDFAALDRPALERAVRAFHAALHGG